MSKGRRTQLAILLSDEHRKILESWQRSTRIPAGLARRGRILLLLQQGAPVSHVAAMVGLERRHVYKWVQRFQHDGLEGLGDLRASRRIRPTPDPTVPGSVGNGPSGCSWRTTQALERQQG